MRNIQSRAAYDTQSLYFKGKGDGVICGDAFGAADLGLQGEEVRAGALVWEN